MTTPAAQPISDLSPFIYGTTRLGDESIPFADRVQTARAAMNAGHWFHTSHSYGDAFPVLRAAFDEDRAHVPPAIFKLGWSSIEEVREQIRLNLEPLNLKSMAIGQLCPGGALAEEFRSGGACYDGFQQMQDEGLVGRFVMEVWPWSSDVALDALRGGFAGRAISGYIFYFNPLQRFVSNDLWDEIRAQNQPIIAMRTVCGGSVTRLRDSETAPEYLRTRAAQVAPLYEKSGCQTWVEFCVRYVFGVSQVQSTVGSTARQENLQEFLGSVPPQGPLPADIHAELEAMQRTWAVEHDSHAAPWSM